jgi:hypothetical protein
VHFGARQVQAFGDLGHRIGRHMAQRLLHRMQDG